MLTDKQRRKPVVKPITCDGVLKGWKKYFRGAFGLCFVGYIWAPEKQGDRK